jgi:rhodanese-related sulfurtransferase
MGLMDGIKGLLVGPTVDKQRVTELVEEGAVLLDVRSASEFAGGSISGAVNIPVQELESRIGELETGRPVVTFCVSGMRSGNAAKILAKHGFTAHNAGGIGRLM